MEDHHIDNDQLKIEIAERIKRLRVEYCKEHNIKRQGVFAQAIGLKGTVDSLQSRISDLENGKTNIRPDEIIAFAKHCHTTPHYILTGEEDTSLLLFSPDSFDHKDVFRMLLSVKNITQMNIGWSKEGEFSLKATISDEMIKKTYDYYMSSSTNKGEYLYQKSRDRIVNYLFFIEWAKVWNGIQASKSIPDYNADVNYNKWCEKVTSSDYYKKVQNAVDEYISSAMFEDVPLTISGVKTACLKAFT